MPTKKINDGDDVSSFLVSKAYRDITTFLLQLNTSMIPLYTPKTGPQAKKFQTWEIGSLDVQFSSPVIHLKNLLLELNTIIDEIPLATGPRRFGNIAFRKWHETVENRSIQLLEDNLPPTVLSFPHESDVSAMDELRAYFLGSFGSSQRLDYGTGHELSFLAFLGCIWKLGGFEKSAPGEEERGIVLGVVDTYV